MKDVLGKSHPWNINRSFEMSKTASPVVWRWWLLRQTMLPIYNDMAP